MCTKLGEYTRDRRSTLVNEKVFDPICMAKDFCEDFDPNFLYFGEDFDPNFLYFGEDFDLNFLYFGEDFDPNFLWQKISVSVRMQTVRQRRRELLLLLDDVVDEVHGQAELNLVQKAVARNVG